MNREQLLRFAATSEDRLMLSRLADKAAKAENAACATWSVFLDPRQQTLAETALTSSLSDADPQFRFDGGYEGAERVLCGFEPDVEWETDLEAPLVRLRAKTSGRGSGKALTHRDWLGALMGLGLKRETIGDILVNPSGADIIVLKDVSRILLTQLDQAGAEKVDVESAELDQLVIPERAVREIRSTVMSMRLDAVAASAFSVSRTRMADWIRAEKVTLDWEVEGSPAAIVKVGSTISIRGKGRAVLLSTGGVSKKGRTGIVLQRMV